MDLLLVEDSPTDRLMHNRLHRAFPKAQIAIADDAHRLADVLGEDNCDVVVTDYWLGWSDGLSVLKASRKNGRGCVGSSLPAMAARRSWPRPSSHYLLKPKGFDNLVDAGGPRQQGA
jgi:DNA-binding NtrC family response regulator